MRGKEYPRCVVGPSLPIFRPENQSRFEIHLSHHISNLESNILSGRERNSFIVIFPRIRSVTFADITFRSGRKRKRKRKFNSKLISLSKNVNHRKRVYFGWKKKSKIYRKVSIQLSCVHLGGKNWEKRIENSHSIFLCVSLERALEVYESG